jgi:hypothetical protein
MQITDNEPMIIVDSESRTITVPDELQTIGVELDNKAEKVVIQIPRFFDDIDFSEKQCVVNYINAKNGFSYSNIDEVTVGDDYLLANWYIPNGFTRYAGQAKFSVAFRGKDDDDYYWSTQSAFMDVLKGISSGDTILGIDINTASELITLMNDTMEQFDVLKNTLGLLQDSYTSTQETLGTVVYFNQQEDSVLLTDNANNILLPVTSTQIVSVPEQTDNYINLEGRLLYDESQIDVAKTYITNLQELYTNLKDFVGYTETGNPEPDEVNETSDQNSLES